MTKLFFIYLMAVPLLYGQSNARATLQVQKESARASFLKSIDHRALPPHVIIDPSFQKVYVLKARGKKDIGLIAVDLAFESSVTYQPPPEQCGVLFIQANGANVFTPTLKAGLHQGFLNCGGVRAIGLSSDPGPRPRIIFIFNNTLLHGEESPIPFVFSWNLVAGIYNLDQRTTDWLLEQPRANTISQVRRLLQSHRQVVEEQR